MGRIDDSLFIVPGANIQEDDNDIKTVVNLGKKSLQERWSQDRGKNIISAWKASGFERSILDERVGKFYNHTDLRGINLSGMRIENADLSNVDLYFSNLNKTVFHNVKLQDSWLSESDIRGAAFEWCNMDKVLVDKVKFNSETKFTGVNLGVINFTLSEMLRDLALGQGRISYLEDNNPKIAWFLRISCDYGRSIRRWALWVIASVLFFALIYCLFPGLISKNGFIDSIYFSLITFTTLGYGDITPVGTIGKIVVITEVSLGYVMGGLLVAILSRRVIGN